MAQKNDRLKLFLKFNVVDENLKVVFKLAKTHDSKLSHKLVDRCALSH